MNRFYKHIHHLGAAVFGLALASGLAQAAEPAACKTVRFGVLSWTDLIATTAVASTLLDRLGYQAEQTTAAQQIIMGGLRDNRLDAFIGYWRPSSDAIIGPFIAKGDAVLSPGPNLADAQMTLAVPSYAAAQGLKTFADLAHFKDKLGGRIYGIDPGTHINATIKQLIVDDRFGLKGFTLVEATEAAEMAAVRRAVQRKEFIAFIAWKPHPMNIQMDLTYLTGSEDSLGPEEGKATVWSVTRKGYAEQCPNVAKLLNNIHYTAAQESEMMQQLLDKVPADKVAAQFLAKHGDTVKGWLEGVTAYGGGTANSALAGNP
jgi:glycine betaine/proline transport system substrate-binding protein